MSTAGISDVYRQPFGIRTVSVSNTQLLINGKPFYCQGVAKHEDSDVKYTDIVLINRYYVWYSDNGHTEVIQMQMEFDLRKWHSTFNIPVMVTEYGADTIPGFHQEPSFVFTEEYQIDFLREYHKAFDKLKTEFLVGEMVWNFADFMTVQGITRVVGNKKGLLTRQRQPKMSGHLIRARYMAMITGTDSLCRF